MGQITSHRRKKGSCEICGKGLRKGWVEDPTDVYQFTRHNEYRPPTLALEKVPPVIWLCVDCGLASQRHDDNARRRQE